MAENSSSIVRVYAAIRMAALSAAFLLAAAGAAMPHGDAQWIQNGNYRASSGELCCGPIDCGPIPAQEVQNVKDGYIVRGFHVPFSQAMPSTDGQYWGCTKPGGIRCFFAPLMG